HRAAAGNGTVVLRGGHAVPISKRCRAQPEGGCAPRRIDAWRPPAAATGSRRSSRPAAVLVIALGPRRDATLAALGETADEWIGHGLVAVLPLRLAGDVQAPSSIATPPWPGCWAGDAGRTLRGQRSSSLSLSGLPSHSLASGGGSLRAVITGHSFDSSALSATKCSCPAGTSSSG